MEINLSKFKVIYNERVLKAVALVDLKFESDATYGDTIIKPVFVDVLVINEDGNIEIIHDETWRFQFITNLDNK